MLKWGWFSCENCEELREEIHQKNAKINNLEEYFKEFTENERVSRELFEALSIDYAEHEAYAAGLREFIRSIVPFLPGETGSRNPFFEAGEVLAKPMHEWVNNE